MAVDTVLTISQLATVSKKWTTIRKDIEAVHKNIGEAPKQKQSYVFTYKTFFH